MKKNKMIWIIIPLTVIMIVGVVAGAVFLILSQKKENRYYEQMNVAKMYLEQADYSQMISAYEAAIELKPEEPEAYIELAEYYLQEGKYYEATEIARLGLLRTNNSTLQDLIVFIGDSRTKEFKESAQKKLSSDDQKEKKIASEKVVLRNNVVHMVSEYCFQQYLNEYKQVDVNYVSGEEGYQIKFKGLEMFMYFKNTSEYDQMIDEFNKKPMPKAKPYKVVIQNPEELFVGFGGYIENIHIEEMFGIKGVDVLESENGKYYLAFEYLGCSMKIETDQEGNFSRDNALIEISPLNMISDWEEEPEEEEEKTDPNTFVLAGVTYTYDVRDISVYDAVLDDLSPLSRCKELRSIQFINCRISDLSPLSGCSSLEELDLAYSTGSLELSCLAELTSLKYLGFHECTDIEDISPIMDKELELLHPCASSVSYEQIQEYINRHPDCEVWFDYYRIN